jgi:formate dehydrogenase major subunit
MAMTRRQFLTSSGVVVGGLAFSSLGLDLVPISAYAADLKKVDRVKKAKQTISTCYFCSVSCGLLCSTDVKTGRMVNIEGDPEHPINEGALCAKGAASFQYSHHNEHRLTKVLYRAPNSAKWEAKTWDWALDRIARKVKDVRDKDFVKTNAKGLLVNRVETLGHMGSSKADNEECWIMTTVARALGMVHIDHQARV